MQTTGLFDLRVSKHRKFHPVHKAELVGRWGDMLICMLIYILVCMSAAESAGVTGISDVLHMFVALVGSRQTCPCLKFLDERVRFFFYVYVSVLCVDFYICVVPTEARRGYWISWS